MAQLLENNFPYVKDNKGFVTNYPATFNALVTFNGGRVNQFVSGEASTVTLTAAQSGGTFLFDSAAGIVYTLPAPVVGLTYSFIVTVSVTSNADKVITNTGTVFLIGTVVEALANGASNLYVGNGTTHISVSTNGTTTGGLQGSRYSFTCVSSTLWEVDGYNVASGTIATPFSTT